MKAKPQLIVMLTHNDCTADNAYEIFDQCKNSKAEYFGFKETPLPLEEMKKLYSYMKECGKKTVLEVVEYTEDECLSGAKIAVECRCDLLMGTVFFDSVNDYCKEHNMEYMPFVGDVYDRPSVLGGTVGGMLDEAKRYAGKGVKGFDLLGYRFTGDAYELIKTFVHENDLPVCVAGSVNSYKRLDEIKEINPWAFTIGSAFFEKDFGETFLEQINNVCDYINK